jgi:hypothetical protein
MLDPLGPPDPSNPWYLPPDWPVWSEASPMIVDPVPPPVPPGQRPKMCCPHCGFVLSTGTERADGQGRPVQPGDAGVCAECCGLCIATETGWRIAGYDEAEMWDRDARTIAMRAIWGKPLPA